MHARPTIPSHVVRRQIITYYVAYSSSTAVQQQVYQQLHLQYLPSRSSLVVSPHSATTSLSSCCLLLRWKKSDSRHDHRDNNGVGSNDRGADTQPHRTPQQQLTHKTALALPIIPSVNPTSKTGRPLQLENRHCPPPTPNIFFFFLTTRIDVSPGLFFIFKILIKLIRDREREREPFYSCNLLLVTRQKTFQAERDKPTAGRNKDKRGVSSRIDFSPNRRQNNN